LWPHPPGREVHARRYAEAASAAGTAVALDIYAGMPHTFHLTALPEPPAKVATTFLECLTAWTPSLGT
jgi:acetyl esterase/lipase